MGGAGAMHVNMYFAVPEGKKTWYYDNNVQIALLVDRKTVRGIERLRVHLNVAGLMFSGGSLPCGSPNLMFDFLKTTLGIDGVEGSVRNPPVEEMTF